MKSLEFLSRLYCCLVARGAASLRFEPLAGERVQLRARLGAVPIRMEYRPGGHVLLDASSRGLEVHLSGEPSGELLVTARGTWPPRVSLDPVRAEVVGTLLRIAPVQELRMDPQGFCLEKRLPRDADCPRRVAELLQALLA